MHKLIILIKTFICRLFAHPMIDKQLWVFSSTANSSYNYNAKYLFEYVLDNYPEITPLYVINNKTEFQRLKELIGANHLIDTTTFRGIKIALTAGVWFTSAGLPIYGARLGKKRLIINLWHGVPLKRIALLENKCSKIYRMYFKYVFSNNYTFILTTSSKLIKTMASSFGVDKFKIKVWGQPRNDVLFRNSNTQKLLRIVDIKLKASSKFILYAPTYRDEKGVQIFPFKDIDFVKLDNFLNLHNLFIFIRYHMEDNVFDGINETNNIKFINNENVKDIMDFLNVFDLLITDYSSIYIDYLILNRPIIFLPYDKDSYCKERGFNFDYELFTPGPKPDTFKKFKNEILKLLYNPGYYSNERKRVNNYFNEIRDPCSQLICEHVIEILNGKDRNHEKNNNIRNF